MDKLFDYNLTNLTASYTGKPKVLVIPGCRSSNKNICQLYDVKRNQWRNHPFPFINWTSPHNIFVYHKNLYLLNIFYPTLKVWSLNVKKIQYYNYLINPDIQYINISVLFDDRIYIFSHQQKTIMLYLDNTISHTSLESIFLNGADNYWAFSERIDSYIYIFRKKENICNDILQYNPQRDIFYHTSFKTPVLMLPSLTTSNNVLYVSGGKTQQHVLSSSLIRWDPRCKKIDKCKSMYYPRWSHRMEKIEDYSLIVIGGSTCHNHFSSISNGEIYDIRTNKWRVVSNMNYPEQIFGSTVIWH